MDNLKLDPYKRLKSILTDGDPLSENGSKNLNELLGIEEEKKKLSLIDRIYSIGRKIDSFIFKKPSKITSIPHKRKK